MEPTLEILLPVRNPGEVFARTVGSLIAQTDRHFSVLISDNYSTSGRERIEQAVATLQAAGLPVRVVRPPWELGRVQHWNWLHHQSTADWLKPLFVGDWLEADCVASCRRIIAADPTLRFLAFYFSFHQGETTTVADCAQLQGRLDPSRLGELALQHGNFIGGPINVLYHRAAFQAAGGHLSSLPLLADADLYIRLALEVPTYVIPRVLGHFLLHENRFAKKGSGMRQRESMNAELALLGALTSYAAVAAGRPVPPQVVRSRMAALLWNWAKEWVFRTGGRTWRRLRGTVESPRP